MKFDLSASATPFTDYDCFIAGIYGRPVSAADSPLLVLVDSRGKLGTFSIDALVPGAKDPGLRRAAPGSKKQAKLNLKVEKLEATVAQQQNEIKALSAQLKEQAAQIQKVSAQLEVSKTAPQVVVNKP